MFFAEIPGLSALKNQLTDSVRQNRIPHAQLFHGNEHSSAFQVALAYTQYISCQKRLEHESCGSCSSCKQFKALSYPDLHFSFPMASKGSGPVNCDAFSEEWSGFLKSHGFFTLNEWAKTAGLDKKQLIINVLESKNILNKLGLKAYSGGYKFQLIYGAERLNTAAANKLLKLIEEPEPNTLLLLISDYPERIIQTILSRCQKTFVPDHTPNEITNHLKTLPDVSEAIATNAAHFANGSLAIGQILVGQNEQLLARSEIFTNWFRACYHAKVDAIQQALDPVFSQGRDAQRAFLIFVTTIVRERLSAKFIEGPNNPLFEQVSFNEQAFSSLLHTKNAQYILDVINEAVYDIGRNGNARIVLLDTSLKLSNALRMKAA
jgi:DNA polymerase-3 subunit delta'